MTAALTFQIEVVREGTSSFPCEADDVILRAGLRAGMALPYECNVGGCGNCKFQLVEGEIDPGWLDAPGTSPRDRDRKRYLACQARPLSNCKVKFLGIAEEHLDERPLRRKAELTGVADVTHDIREFRLRTNGAAWFTPGQYALLRVPGVNFWRAYSMSNIPNAEGNWEFMIRKVPGGAATTALFDHLEVGDCIELDGPYGFAGLKRNNNRDIICIAGGSGVSAMVSIVRGVVQEPNIALKNIHFFYGARTVRDVVDRTVVSGDDTAGVSINFHPVVSDNAGAESTWNGPTGLVHEHVVSVMGNDLGGYEVYMAGPPPMVTTAQKILQSQCNVLRDRIHYDRFF